MPIEFATPEKAEGGVNATMSQVMNLVHDMTLRRDVSHFTSIRLAMFMILSADLMCPQRESDTLASLSQTLQALRASTTQQTQTISRLENRTADLDRQLALTGSQERAAHATLRSAETRNRALREEMARLKGTVAQIRAQCATDVRRRDGEIQRLKRHLEGRRGRDGNGGQVGVVVVTPGLNKGAQGNRTGEAVADLEDPTYSLKQETTEFLTQLSQGLSDENDALIGLVRGTLSTLRSLQGLPAESEQSHEMNGGIGGFEPIHGLMAGPPSYEALATSTDEVLEHLRGLLTNPSFVPIEEVEIREEEIHRLREGWEKMAQRWKEAVALMDGWKKRMVDTGDTINLDDLKKGMDLGTGIPSAQEAHENSLLLKQSEEATSNTSDILKDLQSTLEEVACDDTDPKVPVLEVDINVLATERALGDRDANARPAPSPRKVTFQPIQEENLKPLGDDDDASLLDFSNVKPLQRSPSKGKSRIPLQVSHIFF